MQFIDQRLDEEIALKKRFLAAQKKRAESSVERLRVVDGVQTKPKSF